MVLLTNSNTKAKKDFLDLVKFRKQKTYPLIPSFQASDTMPKGKDYSKDIIDLGDGLIAIPVDASHRGDMTAVFAALKAAPTPQKEGK